jgi:hypothetical protein
MTTAQNKTESLTRWDVANKIADLIKGKAWQGGDKVRVYKDGCGYVEVGSCGASFKNMKNSHNEYSAVRDAGLDSYETVAAVKSKPVKATSGGTCLNCDITSAVLLGRGYCTDCHGEC